MLQALKINRNPYGDRTTGKMINLLANELSVFDGSAIYLHFLWSGPISAVIIGCLLYNVSGISGIFGMVAFFVVAPVQGN